MGTYRVRLHTGMRQVVIAAAIVLAGSVQLFAGPGRLSQDLREGLDAGRGSFDVIVQANQEAIADAVAKYGLTVKRTLKTGAVVAASREALEAMSADESLGHLAGDTLVRSMVELANRAMGADQVKAGILPGVQAVTGRGIGVAVIDSGISAHQALRGRVVATVDFTDPNGKGQDLWGHGTHVAGIIAGSSDTFEGVAPGAHIVSLKVLDETGAGRASSVIAAIDWVIANKSRYGIRIINLSLGRPVFDSYVDDPVCQAVERAFRSGLVVFAAAGNYGLLEDGRRVAGGLTAPANSPYAMAIAAVDTKGTVYRSDDSVAPWSSRGPTLIDGLLKPDLGAPGRNIVSLGVPGSTLAREHPERMTGSGQTALFRMSGTSMATPMASAVAALALEANSALNPAQVRVALQITSSFLPNDGIASVGAGALNAAAAIQVAVDGPNVLGLQSQIGDELAVVSGLVFGAEQVFVGTGSKETILWGSARDTILWGSARDTILWGSAGKDTILWGSARDTILWGSAGKDTILWGSATRDTILWGSAGKDTILWGSAGKDTILWGGTILWG